MDKFDVNNPFGVEFRPDASTPPPSSPPQPPDDDDDDNDDLPRKEWVWHRLEWHPVNKSDINSIRTLRFGSNRILVCTVL